MADIDWDAIDWEETGSMDFSIWDYKQGEKVVMGELVEKRTGIGENKSNLYVLRQPDGELIGVWGTSVLDPRFSTLPVGGKIKIEYLGMEKSEKGGRSYHNFKVFKPKGEKEEPAEMTDKEVIQSSDILF